MLKIILMMACGILVGRMLQKRDLKWLSPLTAVVIWALLFLLGVEVGSDSHVIRSLSRLGGEAALLAIGGVLGSSLCALLLWRSTKKRKELAE